MSTSVKFFHQSMAGAPIMSGTGGFINVLNACLVNGFNEKTATALEVSNNVATMSFPSPHGFEIDSVIQVSGADTPNLNGEKRVLSVTGQTLTFDASGVPNRIDTGGTITAKYAPAGWEAVYTQSYGRVYRSSNLLSTRVFIQFNYEGNPYAIYPSMFQNMTGWNTGSGKMVLPFDYIPVSGVTTFGWIVVATDRTFYLVINMSSSNSFHGDTRTGFVCSFGDYAPLVQSDVYFCGMSYPNSQSPSASASNRGGNLEWEGGISGGNFRAMRSYSGSGGSVNLTHCMESFYNGTPGASGGFSSGLSAYPNGPDSSLILVRKAIFEGNNLRGYAPGLYSTPQNVVSRFSQMQKIEGRGPLAGRKLMAVRCGTNDNNSPVGVVFFDLTGPWI